MPEASDETPWPVGANKLTSACFTVVVGRDNNSCAAAVGGEAEIDMSSALPQVGHWPLVRIANIRSEPDPVSLLWEPDGYEGSRIQVIRELSRYGKSASAYWNANDQAWFACAQRRKNATHFEVAAEVDEVVPTRLRRLLGKYAVADLSSSDVAIRLVNDFIGDSVESQSLSDLPFVNYRIRNPILELRITADEFVQLDLPSEELVAAIKGADSDQQTKLAVWAASEAASELGLHADADVSAFLLQRSLPFIASHKLYTERIAADNDERLLEIRVNSPSGTRSDYARVQLARRRAAALQSMFYLAQPDALTAALGAAHYANLVLRRDIEDDTFLSMATSLLVL